MVTRFPAMRGSSARSAYFYLKSLLGKGLGGVNATLAAPWFNHYEANLPVRGPSPGVRYPSAHPHRLMKSQLGDYGAAAAQSVSASNEDADAGGPTETCQQASILVCCSRTLSG